jgi:hypothetical protein
MLIRVQLPLNAIVPALQNQSKVSLWNAAPQQNMKAQICTTQCTCCTSNRAGAEWKAQAKHTLFVTIPKGVHYIAVQPIVG